MHVVNVCKHNMDKFRKKLKRKYNELCRVSLFLDDNEQSEKAENIVKRIKHERDLENITELDADIKEFKNTGRIKYIENYTSQVEEWLRLLITSNYFDLDVLKQIYSKNKISNQQDLIDYFLSTDSIHLFGEDKSLLNAHFVRKSYDPTFPLRFSRSYNTDSIYLTHLNSIEIKGNFHNHSKYSDGRCTITELQEMSNILGREYIGISDHSNKLLKDEDICKQHSEIDTLNSNGKSKILKSVECEILTNGSLELRQEILDMMDYVIIAVHDNLNMFKKDAEYRLIKAIENPISSILAHPSARTYHRDAGLFVDMHKIIDACAANNVAIEINGDPYRLDLDPQYIDYALSKGIVFTLDSDTHDSSDFKNINNAIEIAESHNIPTTQCLNTFSLSQLQEYFRKC